MPRSSARARRARNRRRTSANSQSWSETAATAARSPWTSGRMSTQPPLLGSVAYDVHAAVQAELFHRARAIRLDGPDAELELHGDLLVAVALRNRAQHL